VITRQPDDHDHLHVFASLGPLHGATHARRYFTDEIRLVRTAWITQVVE
jgi:hypothetical protein